MRTRAGEVIEDWFFSCTCSRPVMATELPKADVCMHGEYWRLSGL